MNVPMPVDWNNRVAARSQIDVAQDRAVFIDSTGTLLERERAYGDPAHLVFTRHALEGLRLFGAGGYRVVIVTHQQGSTFSPFDRAVQARSQEALTERLASHSIPLDGFYACPHAPPLGRMATGCLCRKPAPGLLQRASRELGLDLAQSWMVGSLLDDIEAGQRAGCRTVLLGQGHETDWRLSPLRMPNARATDLLHAARSIVADRLVHTSATLSAMGRMGGSAMSPPRAAPVVALR